MWKWPRAYYSVPPEYVARQVWARWDGALVRVYNERRQLIAVHAAAGTGQVHHRSRPHPRSQTHPHRTRRRLLAGPLPVAGQRGRHLGRAPLPKPRTAKPARSCKACWHWRKNIPWPNSTRPASWPSLTGAGVCSDLKALLARPSTQEEFAFIETHPLIRDLHTYHHLVPVCFTPTRNHTHH